ncbi:N-acetyltransferase 9 [Mycoemilia scoparia]|uniref:N-acetyltransferase 9 n=1 Tax=Mycoemilia scoparia TaxID=417184 RepID=A0A9W8A2M4_9FUNG|nr:N-acetyltransferase 9 [Mycoemilia scoparia]
MRINENTVLVGKTVILVPYRKEHVPRYHEWMKSPELQELTASEPLTLKEEYEMQESWRKDNDKCTFILLKPVEEEKSIDDIVAIRDPEELAKYMIGDVNLYLNDPHEPHHGEIEVMIAEPAYRQKGAAREALKIMMNYGRL